MEKETGRIYTEAEMKRMVLEGRHASDFVSMGKSPTAKQLRRNPQSVGRNEPCGCGSGNKFKKCCLAKARNVEHERKMAILRRQAEMCVLLGESSSSFSSPPEPDRGVENV